MSQFFKVNVSVVIFKENKILVQKRSVNEEVFPGLWGIPGGTLETSDKTLDAALDREVMEEVGIKIKDPALYANNTVEKEEYGNLYLVYYADYASGDAKALEDTEEVRWADLDSIKQLEFTPTTKETIKLAYSRRNNRNRI